LQTSIAFFRVDGAAAKSGQKAQAKPQFRPAPAGHGAQPARKENTVAHQQARLKGFALDLNQGGPDAADGEFRESA